LKLYWLPKPVLAWLVGTLAYIVDDFTRKPFGHLKQGYNNVSGPLSNLCGNWWNCLHVTVKTDISTVPISTKSMDIYILHFYGSILLHSSKRSLIIVPDLRNLYIYFSYTLFTITSY
jgi:hypothetical protein